MKLFVAAMGASSYVCRGAPRESLANWIGCHVGLFAFLGMGRFPEGEPSRM